MCVSDKTRRVIVALSINNMPYIEIILKRGRRERGKARMSRFIILIVKTSTNYPRHTGRHVSTSSVRQVYKDISAVRLTSSRANCNSICSGRIIRYANAGCMRVRVCARRRVQITRNCQYREQLLRGRRATLKEKFCILEYPQLGIP